MKPMRSTAVSVLVAAALLVPAARADRPDDRGGMLGIGAVTAIQRVSARPDDRPGTRGAGALSAARTSNPVRPDDRGEVRGAGPTPTAVVTEAPSRFDWHSAGIGAVGALGLALLVFAGGQLLAHEWRRDAAV